MITNCHNSTEILSALPKSQWILPYCIPAISGSEYFSNIAVKVISVAFCSPIALSRIRRTEPTTLACVGALSECFQFFVFVFTPCELQPRAILFYLCPVRCSVWQVYIYFNLTLTHETNSKSVVRNVLFSESYLVKG